METKKVTNRRIIVPRVERDERPVKAGDVFPVPYGNFFICAMKQSGKTVVVCNILNYCKGRETRFIIISPTVHYDNTWQACIKKLEDKGYSVDTFNSLEDDDEGNVIENFMNDYKPVDSDSSDDESQQLVPPPPPQPLRYGQNIQQLSRITSIPAPKEKKKKRKSSKIVPEWIIVCDDVGSDMRNKYLVKLMKNNRHYKCMVVLVGHTITDLMPQQILQCQYVMIFAKFPDDKLLELHDKLVLPITYDQFEKLYKDATKEKFSFLYINRSLGHDEFRKKFDQVYNI